MELNRNQQVQLLKLARKTIAEELKIKQDDVVELDEKIFQERCGAFVTIHSCGELRGCIGYIVGIKPIPQTICDMARASAFSDPRFGKLCREEFDRIDIEISLLSPLEQVHDVSEIVVGRDGLIITRASHTGLLLPQVAVEQGWERDQFLEYTCYKAGLPGNAWKLPGTKIEKFSAQVFGEKELGLV
jgi:AmmeMemoRadiSam system protein A